jgi:hypothetical protein
VDNYEVRVEQNRRDRELTEAALRSGRRAQSQALTAGVALGVLGYVLAGVGGAGALFVVGVILAAWLGAQRD